MFKYIRIPWRGKEGRERQLLKGVLTNTLVNFFVVPIFHKMYRRKRG